MQLGVERHDDLAGLQLFQGAQSGSLSGAATPNASFAVCWTVRSGVGDSIIRRSTWPSSKATGASNALPGATPPTTCSGSQKPCYLLTTAIAVHFRRVDELERPGNATGRRAATCAPGLHGPLRVRAKHSANATFGSWRGFLATAWWTTFGIPDSSSPDFPTGIGVGARHRPCAITDARKTGTTSRSNSQSFGTRAGVSIACGYDGW